MYGTAAKPVLASLEDGHDLLFDIDFQGSRQLHQRFPDDVALSAKRSDLATDVAPFVKALKNAENQEARKQYGSGLAWFLNARQIYPQSEFADEGIKRLVDRILPEEGGGAGDSATETIGGASGNEPPSSGTGASL
jgi:hypothetical protein